MKVIKKIFDQLVVQELEFLEFKKAWKVLQQLRPKLTFEDYQRLTKQMPAYRVFVLAVADELVAYAGFDIQYNLYEGKHVFVYELVTDEAHRSKGFGKLLLDEVAAEGVRQACEMLVLTSGIQRLDAHRFYEEKIGLARTSLVFRKAL